MADKNYYASDSEEVFSDIRSERDEEFYLNLRIKMEKRHLLELSSFFSKEQTDEYPVEVKKLLGGKLAFDVYMANASGPDHPGSINIVLASDTPARNNAYIINKLDNMTLSFYGYNTDDWFYVTSVRRVPAAVGKINNRVLKAEIVFFYNHSNQADSLGGDVLEKVFLLPNIFDETKIINQRIAHWDEYLKINESFAEQAQVLMEYNGFCQGVNISQLVFKVQSDKLLPAHNNSDIQLVLGVEREYGNPVYKGPVIGTINNYNPKTSELTVDLDFEFREQLLSGSVSVKHSGRLFVTKWGDLVQIRRLRYGLNTFARGQAYNPMLDVFLFDSSKARVSDKEYEYLNREDLLQKNLNEEQHKAVEEVINSKDLYLIQGPPGTGKTTVIAEICYQNAIRGQKTLIASQTNLAVDNALGKLVHHPKIRALRKGNEQSVQEEGKLFIENNVIETWLSKTASDCEGVLCEKSQKVADVNRAEAKLDYICEKYEFLNSLIKTRTDNAIKKAALEQKCEKVNEKIRWLNENCGRFLRDVKGDGYINLLENPYGMSEEFTDTVRNFHATKIIIDEKKNIYEGNIEVIRNNLAKLQRNVDSLEDIVEKYNKQGKYTLKDEKDFEAKKLNFETWHENSLSLLKKANSLLKKKPFGFLISLGFSKKWLLESAGVINDYYAFKASSRYTLSMQRKLLDEILNDETLPAVFSDLKNITEEYLESFKSESEKVSEELVIVEDDIICNKSDIRSVRDEISEFNYSLPYGVKADETDVICRMNDIKSYYISLWSQMAEDDRKIEAFMSDWTGRLKNKTQSDYDALKNLYISNANVIGITCSQSGSKDFTSVYPVFDVAIIDEVSKATPPELILSVLKAGKIVLVGDHKQLPPMVGSDTYEEVAAKLDIGQDKIEHMKSSLFEELFVGAPSRLKTMLSTQYRMHNQIMDTINQFYIEENGYGLKCGLPNPDSARAHMCHGKGIGKDNHALWVDVPMFEENREFRSPVNRSYSNKAEVECIRNILITINENLKQNNFEGKKKIGLISFYSNQVRLMENEFYSKEFMALTDKISLRIGSVDRFQGIECPVVICSFVRNNSFGEIGFAKDPRRVNVALSRAQELSVIVGCSELFCDANKDTAATEIYKTISKYIYAHGGERSVWDFC